CGAWTSFVEEVEVQEVKNARVSLTGEKSKPTKLKDVSSIHYARTKTEMEEFNRVLGGGVVPGSLVLIGGDPGIGKSTLCCRCLFNWLIRALCSTFLGKNLPSRLNCVRSVWAIVTMPFTSTPKPICRLFAHRLSRFSLISW